MSINIKRYHSLIVIIMLLTVFVFSACSKDVPENDEPVQTIGPFSNSQSVNLQLYFLDDNEVDWSIETRTVDVPADMSWAEMTIRELISGPNDKDNMAVLPNDTVIDKVVIANGLANVYLSGGFSDLSVDDELKARVAITNSLCSLQDIKYVGIYGGGGYAEFNEPQAHAQYDDDFDKQLADIELAEENKLSEKESMDIPLYFLDKRNMEILPEVRNCSFFDDDIAAVIVNELLKGPSDEQMQNQVVDELSVTVTDVSTILTTDNKKVVRIEMSNMPGYGLNIVKGYEIAPYAAIVYSITSTMPDISGVVFVADGEIIKQIGNMRLPNDGTITRELMSKLESNEITLYFKNHAGDALVSVTRAIPANEEITGKRLVQELINGPLAGEDENVWPSLPNDLEQDDVLDVYVDNDLAVVDFSQKVLELCQKSEWTMEKEAIFVYSIVNTLCEMNGIKRVQILVEGKQVTSLGSNITISNPLMPNVGIVNY